MFKKISNKGKKGFFGKPIFARLGGASNGKSKESDNLLEELPSKMPGEFSQIYDSGSCLGRELEDIKMRQMITDQSMLEAYIKRGVSEIHWDGEKSNHFDLISEINKSYPENVIRIILRVKDKYKESSIRSCVENIDIKLPEGLKEHKLPSERKEFVIKLIALRVQKLIKFTE